MENRSDSIEVKACAAPLCSLSECDPGEYLAIMPHFSDTDKIRCTVHLIQEFRGSRSWKEVSLNQGTLKNQYLTRAQLRGARFYRENTKLSDAPRSE